MSTASKGLEGIVAADTQMSFIDGEKGVLEYVGIPIDELARNSTFEETVFLLWNRRLPTGAELEAFQREMRSEYDLPTPIEKIIETFPAGAQPMHVLRTAVSAMGMFDPDPNSVDPAQYRRKALSILAKAPAIIAVFDARRNGRLITRADPSLSFAANFLSMLNGKRPTPAMERAFDVCMILHADHGLNASTFTARVIASTLSDVYSAMAGAIGALRGPLHGGANEGVMTMLNEIGSVEKVDGWVEDALKNKKKIMGFGHRVYRAYDPRATYLKTLAEQLSKDTGNERLFEMSRRIETAMLNAVAAKGIYPNVDFYSATTYHALGLSLDLFTPMFALSRISGWSGHCLEQLSANRLIRPDAEYVGPHNVGYTPLAAR